MKQGKTSLTFNQVYLKDAFTIVGKTEKEGPLGKYFDRTINDFYYGTKSFEKCEQKLMKEAIEELIKKNRANPIDYLIAGDLVDHNGISNYVAKNFDVPFLGLYSACATSIYGMIIAASLIDAKNASNICVAVSSHNCTSERVFRYPVEYGLPRAFCSTFTVTGSSAALVSSEKSLIKITRATIGKVIDAKTSNPNDLGKSMAPAALDTFFNHLEDFSLNPKYYDLVVTGDLSEIGAGIFKLGIETEQIEVNEYNDCGLLIYDTKNQDVRRGGSGCACCGVVTLAYLRKKMLERKYQKILVIATGALLNKGLHNQKETIPAISYAIALECE